jgi:hypothetical protein
MRPKSITEMLYRPYKGAARITRREVDLALYGTVVIKKGKNVLLSIYDPYNTTNSLRKVVKEVSYIRYCCYRRKSTTLELTSY